MQNLGTMPVHNLPRHRSLCAIKGETEQRASRLVYNQLPRYLKESLNFLRSWVSSYNN